MQSILKILKFQTNQNEKIEEIMWVPMELVSVNFRQFQIHFSTFSERFQLNFSALVVTLLTNFSSLRTQNQKLENEIKHKETLLNSSLKEIQELK